jgi:TatD DNase family protein
MNWFDAHTHTTPKNPANTVAVQNIIVGKDTTTPSSFLACSVGVHPWYADAPDVQTHLDLLRQWASHPNVCAIGECGLDRLSGPSLSVQQIIFQEQIQIAETVNKPMIIHCVRAFAEVAALRKPNYQAWVMHGFNHRLSVLGLLLAADFYISLGAALLRSDAPASAAIRHIPANRLLLETDNQTIDVSLVYEAAATRLDISLETLQEQVLANARQVYLRQP